MHDPIAEALAAGIEKTRANLAKGAERGRWSKEDADAAAGRLHTAAALEGLAGCDFVIEAAPERLDLKRELFQDLSAICGDGRRARHEHLVDPGDLPRERRGASPSRSSACTSSTRRR